MLGTHVKRRPVRNWIACLTVAAGLAMPSLAVAQVVAVANG